MYPPNGSRAPQSGIISRFAVMFRVTCQITTTVPTFVEVLTLSDSFISLMTTQRDVDRCQQTVTRAVQQ